MKQDQQRVFDKQSVIAALKELREEIEGETCITKILAPLPVFLWDVCQSLGLSQVECDEVLGQSAAFVERWLNCTAEKTGY
jgi:hypothetical protein